MKLPRLPHRVRTQLRRPWLIAAASLIGLVAFVLLVLGPMSWWLTTDAARSLQGKEQADALNAVRQTVLLAFAGAATLSGAAFTARSFGVTRRGQVTDRFHKATAQLGSSTLEERLGGIYSLEQVMRESPRDHAAVLELLCTYVRARSKSQVFADDAEPDPPWQRPDAAPFPPEGKALAEDIQAIITVIARRPDRPEHHRPMLLDASLPRLLARHHEFERPPRLSKMYLTHADLRRAHLMGADLTASFLNFADLRGALLGDAQLQDAHLYRADLRGASLYDAALAGATLFGANLLDTEGISAEQLAEALIDTNTVLPSELENDPWVAARIRDCAAAQETGDVSRRLAPTPKPASRGNDTGA
jgi:pentapeptide repeat protein